MKNNYIYIANQRSNVSEGGMSRNNAFYQFFKSKNYTILNAYDENYLIRFYRNLKFLMISFFFKDKKIVIHQSSLILFFPIFTWKYFNVIYKLYLKWLAGNNRLYIEVNDLPIEQANDLELQISKNYIFFQNTVYTIDNCHYIYASHEMEKYARDKYTQNGIDNQVVINGGGCLETENSILQKLNINIDESKLNFIYAGSLNRGRQIEWMINIFKDLASNLYLIGEEGEWMNEIETTGNIKYLGGFKEDIAQIIASKCDIGIVPYDATRFYYNLCYPTKVSFYLCSQIPILSTKLKETQQVLDQFEVGYFIDENDFHETIKKMSKESVVTIKKNVATISNLFTWEKILSRLIID